MLRKAVQDLLLGPSKVFNNSDWLEKHWFRSLKRQCYYFYKNFYERDFLDFVDKNRSLFAHGHVIDVGANIGFTAGLFSKLTSKPFSVYAFEPERWNYKILEESVAKEGLSNIKCFPYALGETDSEKLLWVNPKNSADHRVLESSQMPAEGESLSIISKNFDAFWEKEGFERISLIKMDIQGYELFALKGMVKTLERFRPNVLIELDNTLLKEHGHSVDDIYNLLSQYGYKAYDIAGGSTKSLSKEELDRSLSAHGYKDILFLSKSV
jgi:FkbM family methyltransferase